MELWGFLLTQYEYAFFNYNSEMWQENLKVLTTVEA